MRYVVFRSAYDKLHTEDGKRALSSREIDQLSHFLNEFSQSSENFLVKNVFLDIKYSFQHRKSLSEDARGWILCFGRIICNKI